MPVPATAVVWREVTGEVTGEVSSPSLGVPGSQQEAPAVHARMM